MYLATSDDGGCNIALQLRHRLRSLNAHLESEVGDGWLWTHPDDIINGEVVAIQSCHARLGINHTHQRWHIVTKEVEEG